MRYKALFLDVDGVLVPNNAEGFPTERVRKSIEDAKEKVQVGLCTTRQYEKIKHIASILDLTGLSIVSGGAQIIDIATGRAQKEFLLETSALHKICETIAHFDEKFWIQDNGTDFSYTDSYKLNKPFIIIVYAVEKKKAEEIIHALSDLRLPEVAMTKGISYKSGDVVDIHITHAKATKEHGIEEVATLLNIQPQEIIGVGDGYNGIPFLLKCGLKIAVGNSVSEVKEIADYVAPSVEQDSVSDIIEKFILR